MRAARLILSGAALALPAAAPALPMRAPEPSAGPMQINCDMLSFTGALDKATSRELVPVHTLDGAAAVLGRHNVPFSRERGTLTFGQMPKKLLDELNMLPAGEPIVLPNDGGGAICVLVPGAGTY